MCSYARCTRSVSIGKLSPLPGIVLAVVPLACLVTKIPFIFFHLQFHQRTMLTWLPSGLVFTWNQRLLTVVRWQVVLQAVDLSQHPIALGPLVVQLLGHFQL